MFDYIAIASEVFSNMEDATDAMSNFTAAFLEKFRWHNPQASITKINISTTFHRDNVVLNIRINYISG